MLFSQKWMNCGGGFIRTSYYNEFIKILCLYNNANIQANFLKSKIYLINKSLRYVFLTEYCVLFTAYLNISGLPIRMHTSLLLVTAV